MRKIKVIDDNNGLQDSDTCNYIRCPYGLLMIGKIIDKQGCHLDCAAFTFRKTNTVEDATFHKTAHCQAGNFDIGILQNE